MAILDSGNFSRLVDSAAQVDRERKRNFSAQSRRSGAAALAAGDELLALFSALPAAVIASGRAVYDRVVARYGKEHPRAQQVADALTDVQHLETQAARGRTRA